MFYSTGIRISIRSWFNTVYLAKSFSRFLPGAYDLSSHRFQAPLIVPGIGFILWSKPYVQLENDWNLPRHSCHQCASGHVLPGKSLSSQGSQLSRTEDYFSPLTVCTAGRVDQHYESWLVGMKLPDDYSLVSPCSMIKVCGIFSNRVLTSSSEE